MTGSQSFEPSEFLDRLKRDELFPSVVLHGMVKPADDDNDYLWFAHGSACKNWVRVPLTSIENISVLAFVPCDDHKHPLVALALKQPETPEGQLFASLMQSTPGERRSPILPTRALRQLSEVSAVLRTAPGHRVARRTARPGRGGPAAVVLRLPCVGRRRRLVRDSGGMLRHHL